MSRPIDSHDVQVTQERLAYASTIHRLNEMVDDLTAIVGHQTAEIDQLEEELDIAKTIIDGLDSACEKLKAEVARLTRSSK